MSEPLPPFPAARFERPAIDYAAFERAVAECDRVIRATRRSLEGQGPIASALRSPPSPSIGS